MSDDPLKLRFVGGLSGEQLRETLRVYWGKWRSMPVLPCDEIEVQFISLRPNRIEPDIEDEP